MVDRFDDRVARIGILLRVAKAFAKLCSHASGTKVSWRVHVMRDAGSPRQPSADRSGLCYKFLMPKIIERWLLFKYIDGELTPLSKPLKKKEQAEQARLKYSERERKAIGIGVIRITS